MTITTIFIIVAFACFVAGALKMPGRVNWTSLGLAIYMLALLIR